MFEILKSYYQKDYIRIIYHSIILISIIVGVIRFKKLNNSSKMVLLLLFITFIAEYTAIYFGRVYQNNLNIYNALTPYQALILGYVFFNETKNKVIYFSIFIFLSIYVYNIFYLDLFRKNHDKILMIELLFIMIWYFIYISHQINKTNTISVTQYPIFWVGLGWLIFGIASIVSFGFQSIYENGSFWDNISQWTKQISNYLLYLSFIPAFLCQQKSLNDTVASKKY